MPNDYFYAYYFALESTGCAEIDDILKELASAGKGCHSTDEWNELGYIEKIQSAANKAAECIKSAKHCVHSTGGDSTVSTVSISNQTNPINNLVLDPPNQRVTLAVERLPYSQKREQMSKKRNITAPGCKCCGRPTRSVTGYCFQHPDMAKYQPSNIAPTGQVTPVPSSQAETSESLAPSR